MRHRPVRLPGSQGWRHHRNLRTARDRTYVVALRFDLRFPASHSLKERRAALRPVVEGISRRFRASVCELSSGDGWQLGAVGVALAGSSFAVTEKLANDIERFVWSFPEHEVLAVARTWMEPD